jgi:hypothetical protein
MIPLHFKIILYTTQAFVGVVGFIGLQRYKQFSAPLQVLEWYILFSLGIDCIKDVMQYYNIRTLWLTQCFDVVELAMLLRMFYHWRTSERFTAFIWGSFFIYFFVWIVGKFSFEPLSFSNTYSAGISQIIQIGFGVWILLVILPDNDIHWKRDPKFWVISGIVIYSSAAFFLFGMFNAMLTLPRQMMILIWLANLVFIILQYIFFLRAFLCKPVPMSQNVVVGTAENFQNQKSDYRRNN